MPAYSPIANSEVDPESPITSSLMVRMRDNPLAIQEGDPTAPRIQTAAYNDGSVTLAKLASDVYGFAGALGDSGTITLPGIVIKYVRFENLGQLNETTINWPTPFVFGIHFAFAVTNRTAQILQSNQASGVVMLSHDLTQATIRNAGQVDPEFGYIIGVGL